MIIFSSKFGKIVNEKAFGNKLFLRKMNKN